MRLRNEAGAVVAPDDPTRLLWYGMCSYWTEDWDKVATSSPRPGSGRFGIGPDVMLPGIPCCPSCGAPGFQITADEWWKGAERFEAEGHPGYVEFLADMVEECHGRGVGMLALYEAARSV